MGYSEVEKFLVNVESIVVFCFLFVLLLFFVVFLRQLRVKLILYFIFWVVIGLFWFIVFVWFVGMYWWDVIRFVQFLSSYQIFILDNEQNK